jgi:hypothetical protein
VTTSLETRLRADLQELADVPGPPSLVDRALADARTLRRRRRLAAGVGALVLTAAIAIPFVFQAGPGLSLPSGSGGAPATCEITTEEADPGGRVPATEQPRFMDRVFSKLPPRDDYHLQWAYGMCVESMAGEVKEPAGLPGERLHAYAVINLGPNREHGHLTVYIEHEAVPETCAGVPTPEPPMRLLFCEDAAGPAPLVIATEGEFDDSTDVTVGAFYTGDRMVSVGAHGTPFGAATLRAVVTDPDLVALLG